MTGYEYACIIHDSNNLIYNFVSNCLNGELNFEHRTTICCNDKDFCNMDLRPTLPPSLDQITTLSEETTTPNSKRQETGIAVNASVHSWHMLIRGALLIGCAAPTSVI